MCRRAAVVIAEAGGQGSHAGRAALPRAASARAAAVPGRAAHEGASADVLHQSGPTAALSCARQQALAPERRLPAKAMEWQASGYETASSVDDQLGRGRRQSGGVGHPRRGPAAAGAELMSCMCTCTGSSRSSAEEVTQSGREEGLLSHATTTHALFVGSLRDSCC